MRSVLRVAAPSVSEKQGPEVALAREIILVPTQKSLIFQVS